MVSLLGGITATSTSLDALALEPLGAVLNRSRTPALVISAFLILRISAIHGYQISTLPGHLKKLLQVLAMTAGYFNDIQSLKVDSPNVVVFGSSKSAGHAMLPALLEFQTESLQQERGALQGNCVVAGVAHDLKHIEGSG